MGNYASVAQVTTRIGTDRLSKLTTDTGSTVNAAKVEEAIGMAEGQVNSHAGRQHRTPINLTDHPELAIPLRGLTIDLAQYHLENLRPPVSESLTKKYEGRLEWLGKLKDGEVTLGSTDTPASTTSREPIGVLTSEPRNASRTNMANL